MKEVSVSTITSRIRAAVGALGIVAFASPLAAQTHHRGAEMRYAAQWVGRSQASVRQFRVWPGARWWRPRYARALVVAGPAWRPGPWRRAWIRRDADWRFGRRAWPAYGRPWRRAWIGWR